MRWLSIATVLVLTGCSTTSVAQPARPEGPPSVETVIAQVLALGIAPTYTGTTSPAQQVTMRSQVEGQILDLGVNVGDRVAANQVIAQVDARLLQTALTEAQATLAAVDAELAESEANISRAQSALAQAELNYQQALNDAARLQELAEAGAISRQNAEQAETQAASNAQVVIASEAQVRAETQALAAQQQRRSAQLAAISRAEQNLAYTSLQAPLSGIVMERSVESGALIRPGEAIIQIGQFDPLEITVPISELEISEVSIGQRVEVSLDAVAGESLQGEVARISPVADPESRQIPVVVQIANPDGQLGSGLFARVTFPSPATRAIVVPEAAVTNDQVFVLSRDDEPPTVTAQSVSLGDRQDGRVQILAGVSEGDEIVVRSSQPLESGMVVDALEPQQVSTSLR